MYRDHVEHSSEPLSSACSLSASDTAEYWRRRRRSAIAALFIPRHFIDTSHAPCAAYSMHLSVCQRRQVIERPSEKAQKRVRLLSVGFLHAPNCIHSPPSQNAVGSLKSRRSVYAGSKMVRHATFSDSIRRRRRRRFLCCRGNAHLTHRATIRGPVTRSV